MKPVNGMIEFLTGVGLSITFEKQMKKIPKDCVY